MAQVRGSGSDSQGGSVHADFTPPPSFGRSPFTGGAPAYVNWAAPVQEVPDRGVAQQPHRPSGRPGSIRVLLFGGVAAAVLAAVLAVVWLAGRPPRAPGPAVPAAQPQSSPPASGMPTAGPLTPEPPSATPSPAPTSPAASTRAAGQGPQHAIAPPAHSAGGSGAGPPAAAKPPSHPRHTGRPTPNPSCAVYRHGKIVGYYC